MSKQGEGSAFVVYLETKAAAGTEPPVEVRSPIMATLRTADGNGNPHASAADTVRNGFTADPSDQRQEVSIVDRKAFDVLLVEDNLINQKVLAKQLRKANCTVAIANHGEEALAILERSTYWNEATTGNGQVGNASKQIPLDVVLMDIEMPVMDGLQCTKQIRALQEKGVITSHIPIIATTANARQEQKDSIIAAGIDSILVKPFNIEQLMLSIQELIT